MDERIASLFPGGEVALDLGCGDGSAFDRARDRYRIAVGMDIVMPEREGCRTGDGGWPLLLADLNRGIPIASGVADAVHANEVIEHVANPLHFAREVHRVMRPGGIFVATTPNIRYAKHIWSLAVRGSGPKTSAKGEFTESCWDDGHIHFFTVADLASIMRAAGFRRFRTSALIAPGGRAQPLRRLLDHWAEAAPIKNFLSGNLLLLAAK